MDKFSTDELRLIRGLATNKYHQILRSNKGKKSELLKQYEDLANKAQNEIIKRNFKNK